MQTTAQSLVRPNVVVLSTSHRQRKAWPRHLFAGREREGADVARPPPNRLNPDRTVVHWDAFNTPTNRWIRGSRQDTDIPQRNFTIRGLVHERRHPRHDLETYDD
jgi:hypothetical protein